MKYSKLVARRVVWANYALYIRAVKSGKNVKRAYVGMVKFLLYFDRVLTTSEFGEFMTDAAELYNHYRRVQRKPPNGYALMMLVGVKSREL